MGYCPFACVESRYNRVYRDTGPGWAVSAQVARPRYSRDRPQHGRMRPRYGRPARGACGSARAHGLDRGRVTIQTLYRGWGRLLYRNMAAIQAATQSRVRHDTALGVAICAAQHARERTAQSTRARGDTAEEGLRHGTLRATTRRSAHSTGAQCAQSGRTMREARVRWVCTCAPNQVLDSVHCF